jgi:hypothetical protein
MGMTSMDLSGYRWPRRTLRGPVKSNALDSYTSAMFTNSPVRATWEETLAWLGAPSVSRGTGGSLTGTPEVPPMRTFMESFWRMTKSRATPSSSTM